MFIDQKSVHSFVYDMQVPLFSYYNWETLYCYWNYKVFSALGFFNTEDLNGFEVAKFLKKANSYDYTRNIPVYEDLLNLFV